MAVLTAITVIVSTIVTVWWAWANIRKFGPEFAAQIGLRPSRLSLRDATIMVLAIFVVVRIVVLAYTTWVLPLFAGDATVTGTAEQILQQAQDTGSAFGLYGMLAVAILFAPVLEELVFRGYLQSALARRMPVWAAISVAAALFATVHGSLELWPVYFILGYATGWVFDRTGSLKAAIAFHFLNNAVFAIALAAS